jgi:hypothetical protein
MMGSYCRPSHGAVPVTRQSDKGLPAKLIAALREISGVKFKAVLKREGRLEAAADIFRSFESPTGPIQTVVGI